MDSGNGGAAPGTGMCCSHRIKGCVRCVADRRAAVRFTLLVGVQDCAVALGQGWAAPPSLVSTGPRAPLLGPRPKSEHMAPTACVGAHASTAECRSATERGEVLSRDEF